MRWLKALRDLLFKEQQARSSHRPGLSALRRRDPARRDHAQPHGIHYAAKRVKKWMKPARRAVGLNSAGLGPVVYQPLGVVGVIVPWNYPLFLHRPADRGPSPPATG